MSAVLWLLTIQGVIGAFDTLYFHEYRAKLPARVPEVRRELEIHAARSLLYGVLFGTLPFIAWRGAWALVLALVLLAEIALTLSDFVVEVRARETLGGVYAGERVTHAIMGIIYGGMLAHLIPSLLRWWSLPTALAFEPPVVPTALRWVMLVMAAGVVASGLRDLYAALGLPKGGWPWRVAREASGMERP